MKIISVIPLKKGVWKGDLSYFTSQDIRPGHVVSVPMRKQKVLALVTSSADLKDTKSDIKGMDFNLRKVSQNLGPSIFSPEYLDSIFESCDYFVQNKNQALASLIPKIFIENYEDLSRAYKKLSPETKTGSGPGKNIKAEKLLFQYPFRDRLSIYKTMVRESFARGKSIFLVLPTESDIWKWNEHLGKGIEQFAVSFHSGINPAKNLSNYKKILEAKHPMLVLATAPFLSIQLPNLGTIILEHENSNGYKMIGRPYLDLRIFTEIYAAKIGARLIIADEMLRFETIGRMETDHLATLYPLAFRIDWEGELIVAKPEDKKERKEFRAIREDAEKEISRAILKKQNVFIFSLRKGLATQTLCRDCGDTVSCPKCGSPVVLYLSHGGKQRMFVCNRCQEERNSDTACQSCGSWNLTPLGIGTDRIEEETKALWPKVNVYKLDKETAKTAKGAKDIIKKWSESEGSILIGTEMAFFYLKESVPLSLIASFDSLWSIPNFKMSEKIIQLILSTLGATTEKLIIQTKNPNDPIIRAVRSGNLSPFIKEELADRKKLEYPPYKRFIKITFAGDKEQTLRAKEYLKKNFQEYSPEIFSGFVSKQQGQYATNALIKIDPQKWSYFSGSTVIRDGELLSKLSSLPLPFVVQVDPEDLL